MEIWEKLGIEPTTDLSEIKTAYAAKAKQYHPEENPEEFQALQKAYKIAAQYAKRNKTVSSRKQPETPGNMLPLWDFKLCKDNVDQCFQRRRDHTDGGETRKTSLERRG